jgi:outer membrane protein assembly factor BamB
MSVLVRVLVALGLVASTLQPGSIPTTPLTFGVFAARFADDGTFSLEGAGWPSFKGTWKVADGHIELLSPDGPGGCDGAGRYRFETDGTRLSLHIATDDCKPRRMILDRSRWLPVGELEPMAARTIVRRSAPRRDSLPEAGSSAGSWPTFRGPTASGVAEGMNLPDTWDVKAGANILWRTPIPGLAHSSPIVWGQRIFVTSAVSSRPGATFKPGLYGDGDASDDRSRHSWMLYAIDKSTGAIVWQRTVHEGVPVDKRHIKSTYASSSPATDGRVVVAWFGSQGVHAYDVNGNLLWRVDLGRVDLGAYDIPTFEWGPASSPIIWNGLVIVQCDTQTDSFLLALNAETGATVWQSDRQELPSWGTPTVAVTDSGPVLVTNASNFVRAYDPKNGRELWRIGRSSKITAPTPVFGDGLFVIASGRQPERPIFAVRPGARGDLTLAQGETTNEGIAWSRTGRGPYMPTPLIYKGVLYVLANNGLFDAYNLRTGAEVYRQRLPQVGNGFSASPVAADDKIYISSEDGDVSVVAAGPAFKHIATNSMGETIMATPALSEGVMYLRTAANLFAIGRKN